MNTSSGEVAKRKDWEEVSRREVSTNSYPKWPSEAMLKIIFGKAYLDSPLCPDAKWKVLDIGCGFGNNLVAFSDIGCECHGVEVHQQIVEDAAVIMKRRGFSAEFRVGSNRSLPYPDAYFDFCLSVNALHYEGSEENILAALQEFRRVLKPGGALYLSTVGPKHEIYKRAETLGNHRYLIKNFDFRDGLEFFFFDNERYLQMYCGKVFGNVETARVTEQLMKLPVDFLIAVCR